MPTVPIMSSLELTFGVTALALVIGAIAAGLNGSAAIVGQEVRRGLKSPLGRIREVTDQGRGDLAAQSMGLAAVLAAGSVVVDGSMLAGVMAMILWSIRPQMAKMLSEEHPLMAEARNLQLDLVIGLFSLLAVAQLLSGQFLMAWALVLVAVSMSWPVEEKRPGRLAGLGS